MSASHCSPVGHGSDEILVPHVASVGKVVLGVLFGGVVLILAELLLPGSAGSLIHAARVVGGSADLVGVVGLNDDDLYAGFSRGASSGQTGSTGAQDQHVAFLVPRLGLGGGSGIACQRRHSHPHGGTAGNAGDKAPAGKFGHDSSPFGSVPQRAKQRA